MYLSMFVKVIWLHPPEMKDKENPDSREKKVFENN